MSNASSFFIGAAGSFVVYMLMFRETRIQVVFDDPANNWRTAVFDFVVFLICGAWLQCFWLNLRHRNRPLSEGVVGKAWLAASSLVKNCDRQRGAGVLGG